MIVKSEEKERIYLCPDCLVLYAQLDLLKEKFVVQVTNPGLVCDVCGRPARYVIVPYSRGIKICERCYRARVKRNHPWAAFKVVREHDENEVCDLCGRKGAKLIVPLKPKERRPVLSVEEDLFERD